MRLKREEEQEEGGDAKLSGMKNLLCCRSKLTRFLYTEVFLPV